MKVLIAGATGLVGSELLKQLEQDASVTEVHILSRRELSGVSSKVRVFRTSLGTGWLDALKGMTYDGVISCLGTTIRIAGSQVAFRKVDYDAVVDLARFAESSKSRAFLVVSAIGANKDSSVFYSRVKGEMEEAISSLSIPSISILRPSLLLGKRKEFRMGERIGEAFDLVLGRLLVGPLAKYRGIPAQSVAKTLFRLAGEARPGVTIYESDTITALAART